MKKDMKKTREQLLDELEQRYSHDGLSLRDHLEGLLYHKGVHYWDYIAVDTLLSLQKPLTTYPNEMIFITYHQICELYFKLCIHEISILINREDNYFTLEKEIWMQSIRDPQNWIHRLKRVMFYFENLTDSFRLMKSDLFEPEEFAKFRMSLIPASGFQSAQFREMEILLTSLDNLQYKGKEIATENYMDYYQKIYWKVGGLQTLKTSDGKYEPVLTESGGTKKQAKTKTLIDFETRYESRFKRLAEDFRERNLYSLFKLQADVVKENKEIRTLLSQIDQLINKKWKGNHYGVISSQLKRTENQSGNDEKGTGGTNWEDYLPPKNQQIKYFPEISADWTYE
jgi:tryptophan 2,3-dioxygenase